MNCFKLLSTLITVTIIAITILFFSGFISALANDSSPEIQVKPNQTVIQVNGIVCSFCAYGTEKNLSKLHFLDHSQFGGDGVHVDINRHQITLALQPEQQLNLHQVVAAIIKGGYDPIKLYLNLHGQVSQEQEQYQIANPNNGQIFNLTGKNLDSLVSKDLFNLQGSITASSVTQHSLDQPLLISVIAGSD